ncbi:hypothetical protein I305_01798 [Cryptococcus gattii E566]|uniref:Zn(2)-C6 fungal-type domain-containing protein n=2 Tax=Cryptococcus gattii TaxID=37769 RepID=E6R3X0_CRYGW|nr:Hypothetical Protein CGB_D4420C [Cryptococcus gattii WM276]ADV21811.1 Hypothetical Protein CGB_D4420C [Cryptococcus gattii WM276]KIR80691.1 hypothetical protein I306_02146 [Cryptococcus gattii EJB2]KIY35549.1 hypothetical protein I305_01798 [Cryptococcus gattii E566]KJE04397.1 hypothetical protein I311_01879 [Cryptococcus gattii NT-10]
MSVTSAHSQNSISPSGVLSAPGAHSAQPETEAGGDLRVRFARACDRCRHRKIKCDNEHPCGKCAAAGVTCTSGMSRPTGVGRQRASRASFSDMRNNHEAPTEKERTPSSREQRPINKGRKRRRDSEETDKTGSHSNSKITNVLDHLDTAHFFLSQEGMPRFAGSTSGLPILEATRRLLQTKPDSFDDEQSPMGEPNWSWLSSLLEDGEGSSKNDRESLLRRQERDEPEYFPGRDHASEQGREDIFARISEIIPPDLMASLVQTYFAVVHPVWPIIHIQSFFADFYKWTSYSFAALVVSMCMLATRYTNDPRVLAEPGNCVHKRRQRIILHRVFLQRRQLDFSMVDFIGMDLLVHEKETSADLFIKRNLRYRAWRFAGEGNANSGSQGILVVLGTNKRQRTAWACYSWDKQLAAICGKPPLLRIWDYDVSLPEVFEETELTSTEYSENQDEKLCAIFIQQILLSVVLEKTLTSCTHHPEFDNCEMLNRWARSMRLEVEDTKALDDSMRLLTEWREALPLTMSDRSIAGRLASPMYSVEYEQIAIIEQTIEMLIAGRKLQLATLAKARENTSTTRLESARDAILEAGKHTLASAVKMGSAKLLGRCDILLAYRILMAGRFLLASLLSARADCNAKQEEEATRAVRAAVVLLRHFADVYPISLGSAEVLEETCRVCRVNISLPTATSPGHPRHNLYAWHRPLRLRDKDSNQKNGYPSHVRSPTNVMTGDAAADAIASMFSPVDAGFALGSIALPFPETGTEGEKQPDFSWLLPGGSVPYYFPSHPSE